MAGLLAKLQKHGSTESIPDAGYDAPPITSRSVATLPDAPYSLTAEQSVLGALLVDNSVWDTIADVVSADDFYRQSHRDLFEIIGNLIAHSEVADLVTVSDQAEIVGKTLDFDYLASLIQNTPSTTGATHYARIVRQKAVLRETLRLCEETADAIRGKSGTSSLAVIENLQAKTFEIVERQSRKDSGLQPISTSLKVVAQSIQMAMDRPPGDDLIGISCGLDGIDEKTSGLRDTDLIIVAGRPAMGKTSLTMNMVEHIALASKLPCAVFSLEMGASQLALRFVSSIARIEQSRISKGQFSEDEWERAALAINHLAEAPIFIDDTPSLSVVEMRARARRLERTLGTKLGVIVVDYLQLATAGVPIRDRQQEVAYISGRLKGLAKEMNCPVIALSQLSRKVEERADKRPIMADLRESGAIEQDADIIAFVYRDEVYNPDTMDKGVAEFIIGKHRNGPTGTVPLAFAGMYTRFSNLVNFDA